MINLKKSGFILLNYIKLPMNLKMALYDYYYRAESLIKYGDPFFARIICNNPYQDIIKILIHF